MYSIPTLRNSGGLSMISGVGKRNGSGSCWWGKSVQEIHRLQNTLYFSKFAISFLFKFLVPLLTFIVMQFHVLLVPRPRQLVSPLMLTKHMQRQGQKQFGDPRQEKQSNKQMQSGKQGFQGS